MLRSDPTLVLRDIHQPPAPPWWPPAPGWWIVAALLLLAVATLAGWAWRRQRRRRALQRLFDDAVRAAATPAAQLAAISELLRRAARRRDPQADRLQGEAWLRFLDGDGRQPRFGDKDARLLLDGGFRPAVDAAAVAALLPRARACFLQWMAAR
ncbi:DUF4381 family protein [Cognatiluteimonas weifangensis]|uniref:DUF4381 family protein n=1 Tax=Cognatiluteimonas weifangensis TaxID=2303539 RepID=A0A372DQZ4_9GAMM|nr:DUF4381 family protein [Luteimonas weifangensis]RFP61985.1 DUF4381 family protein [Luteimonas weifangensis]